MEKKSFGWWLKLIKQNKFTFCFEATKMKGGISLGSFAYLAPNLAKIPEIVSHEAEGHIIDSYVLGPLYLIIIGIPSFLHATFGFTKNYYDFYTEKLANYHAGLKTDEKGILVFIKKHN